MKIILDTMFHYLNKIKKIANQSGIAPLVSIVIISAVALIISANLAYIGYGEMDMSQASQEGGEATDVANSCATDILARYQQDIDFASSSLILSIGEGSCTIKITASSTQKIIDIKSQVGDFYKKISLTANISSSSINVYDWREY